MNISLRQITAIGACALAFGLAGCGGDAADDAADTTPSAPTGSESSAPTGEEPQDGDAAAVAVFEGEWKYTPPGAMEYWNVTVDAVGKATEPGNQEMGDRCAREGTIEALDEESYSLNLACVDDPSDTHRMEIVATSDPDVFVVTLPGSDRAGELARVS